MEKRVVYIDIDGVIRDLPKGVLVTLKEQEPEIFKDRFKDLSFKSGHPLNCSILPKEEFDYYLREKYPREAFYKNSLPLAGSNNFIRNLKNLNCSVILHTRQVRSTVLPTIEWLNYYITENYDGLIIQEMDRPKPLFNQGKDIKSVLIDDDLGNFDFSPDLTNHLGIYVRNIGDDNLFYILENWSYFQNQKFKVVNGPKFNRILEFVEEFFN